MDGVNNLNEQNNQAEPVAEALAPVTDPVGQKTSLFEKLRNKLEKSPLFIGIRKFIVLPLFTLALAAVIVVPIIIFSQPVALLPLSEEEFNSWFGDITSQIDRLNSVSGPDAALAELDRQINQAQGANDRLNGLYSLKASILIGAGREEDAVAVLRERANIVTSADILEDTYHMMAYLYERLGDTENALVSYEQARKFTLERWPENPTDFYDAQILRLQELLNQGTI